jgi:hypothetical protein
VAAAAGIVMAITFRSRIDAWLAVPLLGGVVACLWGLVTLWATEPGALALLLTPLLLAGAGLPLWLAGSTRYTLDTTELRVQCGPFVWRVPVREIRAVTPTRSPLSSPALSLDRLRIDYGRASAIMVSPAERERFLAALESRRQGA